MSLALNFASLRAERASATGEGHLPNDRLLRADSVKHRSGIEISRGYIQKGNDFGRSTVFSFFFLSLSFSSSFRVRYIVIDCI